MDKATTITVVNTGGLYFHPHGIYHWFFYHTQLPMVLLLLLTLTADFTQVLPLSPIESFVWVSNAVVSEVFKVKMSVCHTEWQEKQQLINFTWNHDLYLEVDICVTRGRFFKRFDWFHRWSCNSYKRCKWCNTLHVWLLWFNRMHQIQSWWKVNDIVIFSLAFLCLSVNFVFLLF